MAHPVPSPSPRTLQRVGSLIYLVDPAGHGGPVRGRRGNRAGVPGPRSSSPARPAGPAGWTPAPANQLRWLLTLGALFDGA
jgi:hypothetical protein